MDYLCIFAAVLGLVFIAIVHNANNSPLSHLPGPWYTKFTYFAATIHTLLGDRPLYVHRLHQKYGPVVRVGPDEADICDISAKQTIYSTKETFVKSIFYRILVAGNDHNVFATQDVDKHRYFRRVLSGPLSETSLKAVEPIVRSRVDLAIQRMAESMKTDGFVDVSLWALLIATDVICELAFGESYRTLETGSNTEYINDLKNTMAASSWFLSFPRFLFFIRRIGIPAPIPSLNRAIESKVKMNKYAQESLARYYRTIEDDAENVKPTLFTKLFKAKEEDRLTLDEISSNARAYLVAGSDTTANTLTYLIWSVCKMPQVRDKLVAELEARLPSDRDQISDGDLRELPYLNRVIEETLRLHSVASGALPRTVPGRGAHLSGYWFPAGVTVSSQSYSLHRDPATHPNPETFDPDRWADGRVTKDMKDANMAWGGGSRVCLGMHLARMELRLTTALFFLTFPLARVSTAEGMCDADMEPYLHFVLSPKGGRCNIDEE